MDMIQNFFQGITDYISGIPNIVPILITFIIGVALVGWGYSLFRVWLTILGLYVGYFLGSQLAQFLELDGWPYAIVVILITLAMSLFFWLAVKVSIFAAAFFYGTYLVRYFSITIFDLEQNVVNIIVGLLVAVLAVAFLRLFIIAATAISGAYFVSDAVYSLIQNTEAGAWLSEVTPARDPIPVIMVILLIAISALGILYQYRRSGRGRGIRLHGQTLR